MCVLLKQYKSHVYYSGCNQIRKLNLRLDKLLSSVDSKMLRDDIMIPLDIFT